MNKTLKALGLTAAIAVMIPLSAYAATSASTSTSTDAAKTTTSAETKAVGKDELKKAVIAGARGHAIGFFSQDVLDLLKLDAAALKEKIASGKTLAQIAEAQGVSRDQLKQAMTAAFEKQQAEEKQAFTDGLDATLDSPIGTIAGKGKGGFGMKLERGVFIDKADLSVSAKLLGLSDGELKTALGEGKSLADLAKEKGVDAQKLIDAQKQAIVDNVNEAVKAGKLTQEQADKATAAAGEMAERLVNDNMGFGGEGHKKFHVKKIDKSGVKAESGAAAGTTEPTTNTTTDTSTTTAETNA
ncbi:hypothetical protein [Paenibacillus silvisoli]|uniref:hypothetical protein n=1 Tax=Paenibacillus silvisoli TaxID=3110539 RepID=UPI0028057865|nr:hypothetical protein [Paenibacillus silvisoli]